MFRKKRGKKGISPLIATVLLIGFTVALALLVWLWFSGFISEETQKQGNIIDAQLGCATGIDLGIDKACYDQSTDTIQLTIENNANNRVEGFIIRISSLTDTDVEVFDIPKGIDALNVEVIEVFPSSVSLPDTAVIIPRLNIGGSITSCSEQAIQVSLNSIC